MVKIANLVFNSFKNDSRVLKESISLANNGYVVEVIAHGDRNLPNKMFEYLMAEISVIVSNLYEMKRLVEENKIGVVAKENTPNGLKEAIKKALRLDKYELKKNIQKVKKIYNWENQERVLLNVYKELEK